MRGYRLILFIFVLLIVSNAFALVKTAKYGKQWEMKATYYWICTQCYNDFKARFGW